MNKIDKLIGKIVAKKYGVKFGIEEPSKIDNRDYSFVASVGLDSIQNIDRSEYRIPNSQVVIYDQKKTNMCVAFSTGRIMEQLEIEEHGVYNRMSFGFIYRNRINSDIMKMMNADGMVVREALKHLQKEGVVTENMYSWYGSWRSLPQVGEAGECKTTPIRPNLFEQSKKYKIKEYFKLNSDIEIQQSLLKNGVGVEINMPITKPFMESSYNGGMNSKLDYTWATTRPNLLGYHGVVIEGWKTINNKKYWIVANSWGQSYGDKGYYYLEFGYPMLEAWCMVNQENDRPWTRIQLGAWGDKWRAEDTLMSLKKFGYDTYLVEIDKYWKIQLGAFGVEQNAINLQNKVDNDGNVKSLGLGKSWMIKY